MPGKPSLVNQYSGNLTRRTFLVDLLLAGGLVLGSTAAVGKPNREPKKKTAQPAGRRMESPKAHLQIQIGHSDWVFFAAWSPDDQVVATASGDGTAALWHVETGRVLRVLRHGGRVFSAAWSPDGQTLATMGERNCRLWEAISGKQLAEFPGHHGSLSSDALRLATADDNHTLFLWDCDSGKKIREWAGHSDEVTALSWSPDGRTLASSSTDGTVRLWHLLKGKQNKVLSGHTGAVNCVEWSPDGRTLATASFDRTARLWDAATGHPLKSLVGHSKQVWTAAWSPDGHILATASDDHTARLWEVRTGVARQKLVGHTGKLLWASWSPDGQTIATGSYDKTARLWDASTGKQHRLLEGHSTRVSWGTWSHDGLFFATPSGYGARLWEVASAKRTQVLEGRAPLWLRGAQWSPNGCILATAGSDNAICLWDVSTGRLQFLLAGHTERLTWICWSPDGQTLATASEDRTARLWDVASGKEMYVLAGHNGRILSASWSPDGQALATASEDKTARLWDATTGKLQYVLQHGRLITGVQMGAVTNATWSPDGRTLATACEDQTARLWDVATGRLVRTLVGHSDWVWSAEWSPNGRTLLTCSDDKTARLWDPDSGKELRVLTGHTDKVELASWSPDGKRVVTATYDWRPPSAGSDMSVRLWDSSSGVELHKLAGHDGFVLWAAWSPDGRTLATAGSDKTVRLWDVSTGTELQRLAGHTGSVLSVSWSPDGRILVTSSSDVTTRLWDAASGTELAALASFKDGWVTVSPTGFFDGALQGLKHMHWVVGLSPFDLEQFFTEFYQPGLLKDVLEQRKPIQEILMGRRDPRASLGILRKDRRPVLVTLGSIPLRYDRRKLDFTLTLQDSGPDLSHKQSCGIKDVRVFRNGILAWRSPAGQAVRPGTISLSIPVVAGQNTITAYAFNRDNVKCRDVTAVILGAESLRRQGQAWILAIGIDQYSDPRYNLNYAGADARELSKSLAGNLPLPERDKNIRVTTLLDHRATRQGILEALGQIAKQALPEDIVIVTYAGHGMNHMGHFYLLPHDLGPAESDAGLANHGISDVDLGHIFTGLNAAHVVLILDACHSGQALESEEWRVGPMNARGLPQLAWEKGMDILTASQSNETAKELSRVGHGLLTYALLEAFKLSGEALSARRWLDLGASQVQQLLAQDQQVKGQVGQVARGVKLYATGPDRLLLIQTPRVFHAREDTPDWMISGSQGTSK